MFFDFGYWLRVLRHAWGLRGWRGRRRMLLRLLVMVPLGSAFHALCMLLDWVFFPRLWRQPVRQPVFIIGHARSGTTLMHRLMSADQGRFSYFLFWEMFFPSLLQKKIIRGLGRLDTALGGFIFSKLKAWDDRTFGPVRHMHDMSLWNAEEDCHAMASAFVSQQWNLEMPIMHVMDVFHVDGMGARRRRWLRHYRALVRRQLLLNGGAGIHLAKNPVMSGWAAALIEEFPDARFIVMMRNPEECIPSCLKLVETAWSMRGWQREDCREAMAVFKGILIEHFHHPRAVLAAHPATRHCVVDYRKLTSDPRAAVREAYQALGLEYSAGYDAYLAAQGEREKRHQSGFEYSLEEYGLTAEGIREELREFYRDFQWDA